MPKALIKLAYRQVIGADANTPFQQQVFNATFAEFTIQQQSFSKGLDLFTWSAIKEKFPKANPTLPFKVSFAIAGLLQSLDKKIPGLEDTLHIRQVRFTSHHFQLIGSDVNDRSAHKVAIIYLTDTFTYFGNIGNTLLLAEGDARRVSEKSEPARTSLSGAENAEPIQTFQIKMEENLAVFNYVELSDQPEEILIQSPFAQPG